MYKGLRVAVVVPAFNEEEAVLATVRSVPGFVDHVLVVDDASRDATYRRAARSRRRNLEVLRHPRNRGVGAAIATGYVRALALGADVAAVNRHRWDSATRRSRSAAVATFFCRMGGLSGAGTLCW